MMPALPEGEPPAATISGVTLERVLDEPGPTLLGLPTRHYVYRLRYDLLRAGDAGAPVAVRHEERHEFHATPWGATLPSPRTWRAWRVAEDAGLGAERRELRDAIDSLHEHGLMLRHAIERRMGAGEPEATPTERITREVTSLSVQKIEARVFVKPEGFTPAEFLAPVPEDGAEPTPADPGGAPAPGGAMAGGG
jgi:hypothetical protein